MNVTLDIFSGLPNPSWTLSTNDANKLVSRLAGKALPAADAGDGVLGFRGYIISTASDDDEAAATAGLPETFRVAAGALSAITLPPGLELPALAAEEADDASEWLLTTAGSNVDDDLLNFVKESISGGGQPAGEAVAEAAAAACVIQNTAYNSAFWNAPSVQPHNNCYNYAMNYRSNTFAQPGRISGHPNGVMQVRQCCHSGQLGRLVIGGALNPQNCDRGPYTHFCGYRFSPVGMRVS